MLDDVSITKAEHHLELSDDREFLMKIRLKTSKLHIQASPLDIWISGIWSTDYKEAEDSASMQVIRYIEKNANVVVRDVNYGCLKDLEDQNKNMKLQLEEAKQCKDKLAKGWFLAVRNMHSFSQQISSVVLLNYSLQESPVDDLWNALLCNIADMGFRLKNIGLELEERLEKMLNSY